MHSAWTKLEVWPFWVQQLFIPANKKHHSCFIFQITFIPYYTLMERIYSQRSPLLTNWEGFAKVPSLCKRKAKCFKCIQQQSIPYSIILASKGYWEQHSKDFQNIFSGLTSFKILERYMYIAIILKTCLQSSYWEPNTQGLWRRMENYFTVFFSG